jgi:hypothetical protein
MDDTSKLLSDILAEVNFLFEKDGTNATLTRTEYQLMLKIARLDEILSTPGESCLLPDRWDSAVKYSDNEISAPEIKLGVFTNWDEYSKIHG